VLLEGLTRDFPRNYVFYLELGSMYEDAGDPAKALTVFRSVRQKISANEHRFGRMPARSIEAVDRKVKDLEQQLANRKTTAAHVSPRPPTP
jgi:hypothetical protein